MNELNNLQKALLLVEEEESYKYDIISESPEPHRFSRRYVTRRREIINLASDNLSTAYERHNRGSYRLSLRTILVAALVMLLATASVIAITKPHIYYVIKEKFDSWNITFAPEGGSEITDNEFIPVKPPVPDGFTVVMEDETETNCFLTLEGSDGTVINYEQMLPDGTAISVDSEHSNNTTEVIRGTEVVISREEDTTTYIFNDGQYIYEISGNADEKLIREMVSGMIE